MAAPTRRFLYLPQKESSRIRSGLIYPVLSAGGFHATTRVHDGGHRTYNGRESDIAIWQFRAFGRQYGARFHSALTREHSSQSQGLPRKMGGALLLSERLYQWVHD